MKQYKYIALFITIVTTLGLISMITELIENQNRVVIVTSAEDYRVNHLKKELDKKFKDIDIEVVPLGTGKSAAKIKAEGKNTETDIVMDLEVGHSDALNDFYDSTDFMDKSVYLEDTNANYVYDVKCSGAFIINPKVIKEKGLEIPRKYEDLLKPEYKGLIAMPDPKVSGGGYMFYLNIMNLYGEEKGLEYIDKLEKNIKQFTTSGSAPVKMLLQEEIAIGFGLITQSTNKINEGANLEIIVPETGAPWTISTNAIIKGKAKKENVRKVFEYIATDYTPNIDGSLYNPDKVYKNQQNKVKNYPKDIKFGDMTGLNSMDKKKDLISKWKY